MKKLLHLVIGIILFFPTKFYHLFFLVWFLLLLLVLAIYSYDKIKSKGCLINPFIILFFIYLFLGSFIRFIYFGFLDLRDFMEIFRFFPILLILSCKNIFTLFDFKFLLRILKLYIIIDFIISYLQINNIGLTPLNIINNLYASPHHFEVSLLKAKRALGLSSSPGEHGLTILSIVGIILFHFFRTKYNSLRSITGDILIIYLGYFSILLSQSQTAFIGIFILNFLILLILIVKGLKKIYLKGIISYTITLILILPFVISYINNLRYLTSLFELGLHRSSYQERIFKWEFLLEKITEYPLGIFIGWGKSFFGYFSTSMDNEHLYIILCYGPIVYLLLIAGLIYLIYKTIYTSNFYKELFIFLILLGLPLAWPNAYFLTPKVYFLLSLIFVKMSTVKKVRYRI